MERQRLMVLKSLSILIIIISQSALLWAQTNTEAESDEKKELTGVEQISEIQKYLAPFEYDRNELRDPFEAQGTGAPLQQGKVYGPFLPLQVFRLSEFNLKGLLWQTEKPIAIIESPDGKEHRLTIKDYVGENFGYIASIREKEVVVVQTIEENTKRYSTTKVLFLE